TLYNNQPKFRLEWIPFEEFTNITKLEMVEKRHNRNKNQTVALKVLKDSKNINSAFLKELQNIVKSQLNSNLRHIIQCYGVSQFPKINDYIFVMSYMSNGNLNDYLSNNNKLNYVTWTMKYDFLRDIVTNGPDSNTLIADLGFSRPAKDDLESLEPKIYEIMPYVAPQLLNKKQYSFSSDIYSLRNDYVGTY
ncbi:15711_t:CDS:2, partial [Cetraspora pellucida]